MWLGINYSDVCKIEKEQLEARFTEEVRREMLEKMKRRQRGGTIPAPIIPNMDNNNTMQSE